MPANGVCPPPTASPPRTTSPPSCSARPARSCARCSGADRLRVLVTRARADAEATAARLRTLGHDPVVAPLLAPRAVAWEPPPGRFDAILLTSARAAELAGTQADRFRTLPAYAVGARTAAAARAAGFAVAATGDGDAAALLARLDPAHRRLLHLAGRDRTPLAAEGVEVIARVTYAVDLAPLSVSGCFDWVLLYSPRTAAHFAAESARLALGETFNAIAAISPAALAAAGPGWRTAVAAAEPTEAAILAAAGLTCDKRP